MGQTPCSCRKVGKPRKERKEEKFNIPNEEDWNLNIANSQAGIPLISIKRLGKLKEEHDNIDHVIDRGESILNNQTTHSAFREDRSG